MQGPGMPGTLGPYNPGLQPVPQVMPIQRQNPAANIHTVSETQTNFIHKRIAAVEHHFAMMCKGVAGIARKYAKCRDCVDDLARIIVAYTETETLNLTMRNQVTHLADTLCAIADIQQTLVEQLEMKIVGGFSSYKDACKHARADLASTFRAQSRQVQLNEKLEQMRAQGSSNMRQLHMAETELQRAAIEVSRTHAALEESMEYFEMKKLRDLRRFLLEFCHTKIQFHARNVEMFTRAYQMIQDIKVNEDLEDFNKAMMFPPGLLARVSRTDATQQGASPSRSDLHNAAGTSSRKLQQRYAAGNDNSPYNRADHARSQSMDREPGARMRVQSRPRLSDRDAFTKSYASINGGPARPSRSRST